MARQLIYHLNRLQDILALPRTSMGNYPDVSDPLHDDSILTEDIWEASKVVTADLARRGIIDVVSTTTPITKGQNSYTLPADVCKLHAIEYFDGTYWKGPLSAIPFDDYVKMSVSKTESLPKYYTHTVSDAREVYLSVTDGITESSFRDTGPLTLKSEAQLSVTASGEQINRDDLVFNITQDSAGVVDYLDMSSNKLSTASGTVHIKYDYANHTITIKHTSISSATWASIGDMFKQGQTWAIITDIVTDTAEVEAVLTFDGTVRGANDAFASTGTDGTTSAGFTGTNLITIGKPDRLIIKSDNPLILPAQQGLSGSTASVIVTMVSPDVFSYDHQAGKLTISNPSADVDLTAYSSLGYTISITDANDTYTGYVGAIVTAEVGGYDQSTLDLTSNGSSPGVVTSLNTAHTTAISGITSVSITKPPLFKGDVVQVESQFATLDTVKVYPYPDRDDTVGSEGLRITYAPYPSKPSKPDQVIELPDAFNDAILAKAFEYSSRRADNRMEPYEQSLRRATAASRPQAPQATIRGRRDSGGGINYWSVP